MSGEGGSLAPQNGDNVTNLQLCCIWSRVDRTGYGQTVTQGYMKNTNQLLNAAGLRSTKARGLVLETLNKANRPLSHQEIAAEPEIGGMDRVTLYRTLTTLNKAGLLHRVQGIDGVWRFRGHRSRSGKCGGDHIHFLCLECGQMSCLPEQPLPWVKEPDGAEVFGKQLVVYGRCAACNKQEEPADVGQSSDSEAAEPNAANRARFPGRSS